MPGLPTGVLAPLGPLWVSRGARAFFFKKMDKCLVNSHAKYDLSIEELGPVKVVFEELGAVEIDHHMDFERHFSPLNSGSL